jgi:hypothetical protein
MISSDDDAARGTFENMLSPQAPRWKSDLALVASISAASARAYAVVNNKAPACFRGFLVAAADCGMGSESVNVKLD